MEKYEYQYIIEDGDDEFTTFRSNWVGIYPEYIATDAAECEFYDHDGWEHSWPIPFSIFKDKVYLGTFEVDMEPTPAFSASMCKEVKDALTET